MTTNPGSEIPQPPAARSPSVYTWAIIILGCLLGLMMVYRLSNTGGPPQPAKLPKMWTVPPFVLTERSGKQITNRELSGKIWIADFIYTTCPGPCPIMTASMAKLQDALAQDSNVQLVSFSVDPMTDTPGALAKYADLYHADANRWWFLTGPEKPMYDLIQNGFRLAVMDNSGQPLQDGQFKVTHSTNIVLVDPDGNVRGFYDGTDSTSRGELLRDIKVLESEAKQ